MDVHLWGSKDVLLMLSAQLGNSRPPSGKRAVGSANHRIAAVVQAAVQLYVTKIPVGNTIHLPSGKSLSIKPPKRLVCGNPVSFTLVPLIPPLCLSCRNLTPIYGIYSYALLWWHDN
jgi:hypothetical protein